MKGSTLALLLAATTLTIPARAQFGGIVLDQHRPHTQHSSSCKAANSIRQPSRPRRT